LAQARAIAIVDELESRRALREIRLTRESLLTEHLQNPINYKSSKHQIRNCKQSAY